MCNLDLLIQMLNNLLTTFNRWVNIRLHLKIKNLAVSCCKLTSGFFYQWPQNGAINGVYYWTLCSSLSFLNINLSMLFVSLKLTKSQLKQRWITTFIDFSDLKLFVKALTNDPIMKYFFFVIDFPNNIIFHFVLRTVPNILFNNVWRTYKSSAINHFYNTVLTVSVEMDVVPEIAQYYNYALRVCWGLCWWVVQLLLKLSQFLFNWFQSILSPGHWFPCSFNTVVSM